MNHLPDTTIIFPLDILKFLHRDSAVRGTVLYG